MVHRKGDTEAGQASRLAKVGKPYFPSVDNSLMYWLAFYSQKLFAYVNHNWLRVLV